MKSLFRTLTVFLITYVFLNKRYEIRLIPPLLRSFSLINSVFFFLEGGRLPQGRAYISKVCGRLDIWLAIVCVSASRVSNQYTLPDNSSEVEQNLKRSIDFQNFGWGRLRYEGLHYLVESYFTFAQLPAG